MQGANGKRDLCVELLRVIAALEVIGTHVKLEPVIDGSIGRSRLLVACFVGDGVAIFWMILGFFYFANTDTRRRLTRLVKRIVLPMLAFSALMFFCYDFIVGKDATLLESLRHPLSAYRDLLTGSLLKFHSTVPATSHFWYLWVYILMILIYPALKPARDALTGDAKRDRRLLLVIFCVALFNDLSFNGFLKIGHHTTDGMVGAIMWVLAGDIMYRNRALYKGNARLGLMALTGVMAVAALRFFVQAQFLLPPNETNEPQFWYTSFAFASVLCLAVFVYGCLSGLLEKNRALGGIVAHLGGMTFSVYIWHKLVIKKLTLMGFPAWLEGRVGNYGVGALAYQAVYVFVVFMISLAVSEATALPWRALTRCVNRRAAPSVK